MGEWIPEPLPEPQPRAGLDRAVLDQQQRRLDEQVRARFPDGGVQRVTLLQHGDDPQVEPGDLLVRVFIEETGGNPSLPGRSPRLGPGPHPFPDLQ